MKTASDWLGKDDITVHVVIIIIITAVLYYFGTIMVGILVRRAVRGARSRTWHRKDVEKRQATLVGLFTNMWRIFALVIGAYWLLTAVFGTLNLAPLFASAGIIGVAIGFGSQALVKDFLSGIFIISENQYRVGDIIEIDGNGGTVERIGTRSTVIRDVDGNVHYFPNGTVQHVINKTMGYSMARFTISVQPSSDIDQVIDIINKTGQNMMDDAAWKGKIIDAPAFVSIGDFTAHAVSIIIAGKTQPSDQWAVVADMRRHLLEAFEKNNIELGGIAPVVVSATKK